MSAIPSDRALPLRVNRRSDEDRINDEFHTLLREAAEKREERERVHSSQDAAAAKQESLDLISLARSMGEGFGTKRSQAAPPPGRDSGSRSPRRT